MVRWMMSAEELKPCGCRNDMKTMCFFHSENGGWESPEDISLTQAKMEVLWKHCDQQELNPDHPNICKICGNHVQSDVHGICRTKRVEQIIGKCSCGGADTVKEAFEQFGDCMFVSCGNCGRYSPAQNYYPDPDEVQAILRSRS